MHERDEAATSHRQQGVAYEACLLMVPSPKSCLTKPVLLKSLRTLWDREGSQPPLTCGFAPIHTLKRNSTTSPSAIT